MWRCLYKAHARQHVVRSCKPELLNTSSIHLTPSNIGLFVLSLIPNPQIVWSALVYGMTSVRYLCFTVFITRSAKRFFSIWCHRNVSIISLTANKVQPITTTLITDILRQYGHHINCSFNLHGFPWENINSTYSTVISFVSFSAFTMSLQLLFIFVWQIVQRA